MHTILDAEHETVHAAFQEPFEKALAVACAITVLRKGCRWQLLLIPYQNHLLRFVLERYEAIQLDGLAGLVDDQVFDIILPNDIKPLDSRHG
jgi:hypothetical protein